MKKLFFVFILITFFNISNSQSVGQTPGAFSVSLMGASNYSVPIKMATGIKDMIPNISLGYSNQRGNGIAGWGWNIEGLSEITRETSSILHDGLVDPIDFDEKDRFSLDGQKLILKTGTYGGNAEYQLENYSNIKIISVASSEAYTPSYFTVFYPDGSSSKYVYNGTNDKFKWRISVKEDVNHNTIVFNFNYNYLQSIEYGGNSSLGTPNINKVNFFYNSSSRNENSLLYGGMMKNIGQKLYKIEVLANSQLFRRYLLEYNTTSLNYDRLTKIQEFNINNESLKPIIFEYDTTENGLTSNSRVISNVSPAFDNKTWQYIAGYFDNDSNIDFITYPNTKDKVYSFNSKILMNSTSNISGVQTQVEKFTDIFSTKLVLSNNKLNSYDLISAVTKSSLTGGEELVKLNNYKTNINNSLDLLFSNSFIFPAALNERCIIINGENTYYSSIPKKYFSGDFNGDGVSEIIAFSLPYSIDYTYYCGSNNKNGKEELRPDPDCCTQSTTINTSTAYLLKPDSNNTTNISPTILGSNNVVKNTSKIQVADFDGDGKSDLYVFNNGSIDVFTLEGSVLKKIYTYNSNYINSNLPYYFGDFNGDGKTDIVIPTANASSNWYFIMSTGSHFLGQMRDFGSAGSAYYEPQVVNQCYPLAPNNNLCGYMLQQRFYLFSDLNGDGKSDFMYHDILTPYYLEGGIPQWNYPYNTYGDNYSLRDIGVVKYNIGTDPSGTPIFSSDYQSWQNNYANGGAVNKGTPIFLNNPNASNQNLDYAFFGGDKIKYISLKKDNRIDVTLKRIKENDVTTTINYSTLSGGNGTYYEDDAESYPFVNINNAPSIQIVNTVTKSFNNENKIQQFKYYGAVSNLEGLGFLGFKGVAQTNIYSNSVDNKTIWTVSKHSPQKRGAVIESYSSLGSVDFQDNTNNFITKSIRNYNSNYLPNKVFVNLISQEQKIDNLTGISENTYYEIYDQYFNLLKSRITAVGGEKIKIFEYENNPTATSNQYYIGRPLKETETQTLGNEIFSFQQEFTYTNNIFTQLKKKGDNTDYLVENYEYDDFGNITKKILSTAGLTPRIESMQYDSSGRFMTKYINVLGFEDTYNYDYTLGVLLSKKNHFDQIFSYEYDGWQRKIKEKDFYNNYTQYSYEWITSGDFVNGIKLKIIDPSGLVKETYSDAWGRRRLERELSINNKWIDKKFEYDVQDRLFKVSDPYFSTNSPNRWTITEFDEYNRVKKLFLPTGSVVSTSYNGLNTTISDESKTKTSTRDAWGNIIKMVDDGGTINYTYYANGGLKSSNFANHIVTIEQDGWGRKTKLYDPSIGDEYIYVYDNWGQLLNEKNPKGNTYYQYDQFGRVSAKSVIGDNTNISIVYNYDNNGLLISEVGSSNGVQNSYNYSYDNYYRLLTKEENNGTIIVKKSYTYDNIGRTQTETTDAKYGNFQSIVSIENKYDSNCGILIKILDATTQATIWQLNSINEKEQILSSSFGNGINANNTYDNNYFVKTIVHSNANQIINNEYDFNSVLGTLNYRKDYTIGTNVWAENFTYDSLGRLTSWSDPNGTQSQSYDNYGRIDNNSNIGDYKYESGNRYRKKGINLNPMGDAYYSVNSLQQISYNAYRSPVSISQKGTEIVSFGYNIHQTRASSSIYTNSPNIAIGRAPIHIPNYEKRFYNDDQSVEIISNVSTISFDNAKIIIYIAGNPYSAPAVYIKKASGNTTVTEGYHYLHRDYQGTILAISDQLGNVEEQRHYDAWGNLVKLKQNGIDVETNSTLILDRGYTGHEHFTQVGLIHMNGRMYDSKLHTFLSVDNNIQEPFNTQNYNRFAYVLNNPLMYTDYSGEIFGIDDVLFAVIVGALVGGYSGYKIAKAQGISGWGMAGYIVGGAVIGGLSGGAGATISAAGGAMAVTAAMIASSFSSSMLFSIMSNGATPTSIFFGFGSINLDNGDFSYIGEKGNSFLEDLGYFFGAFANVSDVISLFGKGTNVEVTTQTNDGGNFDPISHSSIIDNSGNINISVGPDGGNYFGGGSPFEKIENIFKKVPGDGNWSNHLNESKTITINNVNSKILESFTTKLQSGKNLFGGTLIYSGIGNSCVSYVSRALWLVGVPNIGIHPFLNALSLGVRQTSLVASPIAVPIK